MCIACFPTNSVAIIFSTVGSVLAIFGDTLSTGGLSIGWSDAAGLSLAFLSFVCISLCTVTIGAIGNHPGGKTPDTIVVFWLNLGCVIGALPTFWFDRDEWYVVFVPMHTCFVLLYM